MPYTPTLYKNLQREMGWSRSGSMIIEFLITQSFVKIKPNSGYFEVKRSAICELLDIHSSTLKKRVDIMKGYGWVKISHSKRFIVITDEFRRDIMETVRDTVIEMGDDFDRNVDHIADLIIKFREELIEKRFKSNKQSRNALREASIYFLEDQFTKWIKIGMSRDLKSRIKSHRTANPTAKLLFYFDGVEVDEKIIHNLFSKKWVQGEWFELESRDINKLHEMLKENNKQIKYLEDEI